MKSTLALSIVSLAMGSLAFHTAASAGNVTLMIVNPDDSPQPVEISPATQAQVEEALEKGDESTEIQDIGHVVKVKKVGERTFVATCAETPQKSKSLCQDAR